MLDNTTTSNAATQDAKSGLVRVMGLWENKDRKGNKYLSGNLTTSVRVMVFKNSFKQEGGRDPDYVLYVAQRSQDERQGGAQGGGGQDSAQSQAPAAPQGNQTVPEDDIPF